MILKAAQVFLIEEKGFKQKDIKVKDGKIIIVADHIDGKNIVDCFGRFITPGLIDAHSHLGMWEEGIGIEGADGNELGDPPFTRMGIAATLRTTLNRAKDYHARKEAAGANVLKHPVYDEKMENLKQVIDGKIPLKAHVHRADDIITAIRLAREFDLEMTLDHCTEGHLVKEEIKQAGLSVILGPTFGFKTKNELLNKSFKTAKVLNDHGIKLAIMTDHPVNPQSSLVLWAALSVKAGLSEFEAFKAVTLNPAQILGIDDITGQIQTGLDADLVIWDRHPFDIQARVLKTLTNGKPVYEYAKQAE